MSRSTSSDVKRGNVGSFSELFTMNNFVQNPFQLARFFKHMAHFNITISGVEGLVQGPGWALGTVLVAGGGGSVFTGAPAVKSLIEVMNRTFGAFCKVLQPYPNYILHNLVIIKHASGLHSVPRARQSICSLSYLRELTLLLSSTPTQLLITGIP
ncbi:hypothetical protein HYPSUDRAFT_208073 [Hypholoma sublateritium FD-334 SS-4]|uniref:Uncharacterized protein n=1 Tax=Hypholoma sublateritium (strain FD-334 SS-4) TaxID=945553 RepID=A0A0D2KKT7_HYPSF|nr:hypothetical protein HYPSUDRAFT_208073 [Hypholoma sublateritium FD-334 SS-4]